MLFWNFTLEFFLRAILQAAKQTLSHLPGSNVSSQQKKNFSQSNPSLKPSYNAENDNLVSLQL